MSKPCASPSSNAEECRNEAWAVGVTAAQAYKEGWRPNANAELQQMMNGAAAVLNGLNDEDLGEIEQGCTLLADAAKRFPRH
jgi:hypothetical protein